MSGVKDSVVFMGLCFLKPKGTVVCCPTKGPEAKYNEFTTTQENDRQ